MAQNSLKLVFQFFYFYEQYFYIGGMFGSRAPWRGYACCCKVLRTAAMSDKLEFPVVTKVAMAVTAVEFAACKPDWASLMIVAKLLETASTAPCAISACATPSSTALVNIN